MWGRRKLFCKKAFSSPTPLPLSKNTEKEQGMFKKAQWIWCSAKPQGDEYGEFYKSFDFSGEEMIFMMMRKAQGTATIQMAHLGSWRRGTTR